MLRIGCRATGCLESTQLLRLPRSKNLRLVAVHSSRNLYTKSVLPTLDPLEVAELRRRPGRKLALIALLLVALVGVLVLVAPLAGFREPRQEFLMRFRKLVPAKLKPKHPRLTMEPITAALRAHGYHECNPHDPIGLGPYDPYRNVRVRGRMLIPQSGGHTDDMGFDVLIHFHGHEPIRKTLVQVARGISFVGIDLGIMSGPYMKAFQTPGTFDTLLQSVESALRDKTGDDRAHIRNLGLSAWSAGYGAVNEILKEGDHGIDAVILLDGLHTGFDPSVPEMPGRKRPLSPANIAPILDFAREAKNGKKLFVFTHSSIDPVTYPSTTRTANLVLEELSLSRTPVPEANVPFPLTGRADYQGFHLWSYEGRDTKAHCQHIRFIGPIVRDILEPRWDTPYMDRDVPYTKAPKLGVAKPKSEEKLRAAMAEQPRAKSGG